jgi:gamma-glutamyltranspeptidase
VSGSQLKVLQSHISVVDKDGMAVALTSSVNLVFGSEVMDPDTGIILNDEVSTTLSLTTIIIG